MKKAFWIILIILICGASVYYVARVYYFTNVLTRTSHVGRDADKAAQAIAELTQMMSEARICKIDSDCVAKPAFGACASGNIAVNKKANIKKMLRKTYEIHAYFGSPTYSCAGPKVTSGIEVVACVQSRCELNYK